MKEHKFVISDFDGTLITQDLEQMFMKYLLSLSHIRWRMLLTSCFTLPINMPLKWLGFGSCFKSWTFVLKDNVSVYIQRFLDENIDLIMQRDEIWEKMLSYKSPIILLSGCYQDLLVAYLIRINRLGMFEKVIGCTMRNHFVVAHHPYGRSKCKFINKNNFNIGIANERSDHFYLDMCDEAVYV